MIRFLAAMLCLLALIPKAGAETLYVSEQIEISLRSGPGTDYKILGSVKTGDPLEFIEASGGWTRIRLKDGREGWVGSRFVGRTPPGNVLADQVHSENESIKGRLQTLAEEKERMAAEEARLRAELAKQAAASEEVRLAYEKLQKDAAEVVQLRADYEAAKRQLTERTEALERMEEDVARVQMTEKLKWFLSGAGVFLIGFLVGFVTRRQRRRSLLL